MKPISRRQALALGLVGAGATAAGGAGLLLAGTDQLRPRPGSGFTEPEMLSSSAGSLDVHLEPGPARVTIGDHKSSVAAYNGSLPGPTLRLRPGERLRATLANRLDEATNLHVHGLHVSPEGNGDNAFISVAPGESFDYEFILPPDHPPGTYWYHPHHHGTVARQLAAGLYGAIIVQDPQQLPVTRERVLVVSDISLDRAGNLRQPSPPERMMGREGQTVLVNGHVRPVLSAAPGERERWRIINACPARYLRLQIPGQQLRLLARDGSRLAGPRDMPEILLAPGNRAELLLTLGEGSFVLLAAPYDRGSMGAMMGRGPATGPVDLLSVDVRGEPSGALPPIPPPPRLRDLRTEPVAGRRRFDFSTGMGPFMDLRGMAFTINGKQFDAGRTDESVGAGTVEEWTLTNSSPMDHPLHLHIWPMQVIGAGNLDPAEPVWQDVVNIPARGEVKVLVAFDDFTGRTVFHCHILDHEDMGMMGVLEAR